MNEENKNNNSLNEDDVYELVEEDFTDEVDETSQLKNSLNEKEKELLYLRAEYDNYRKQAIKEKSQIIRYAGENFARDLLNVLDVFEKALSSEVNESNFQSFVEGIKLTEKELQAAFKKHHISEFDCKGKAFDPSTSEALSQVPTDKVDEGHVFEVMRKGYLYHDKVLRHAQVVLASKLQADTKDS